jgi:phosphoglucosamine mutase
MTAELALRLGAAAGRYFRRDGSAAHRVVIGKDTRLSGYMFENALTAGFTSTGMNVLLLGPVPTPAVGLLTRSMRADVGVMISASHNPHQDNGIKFFGPDGFKLSDEAEAEIEAMIAAGASRRRPRTSAGRSGSTTAASATSSGSRPPSARLRLDGLKVVIDCANGAAYRAAPEVLWELGAEVIPMGVAPNGSTSTTAAARPSRSGGAARGGETGADSASASTATPTG